MEMTTCLKRGEVEVVTRYEPAEEDVYAAFAGRPRAPRRTLFSEDGRTVDEQVADLLRAGALTIATAESCTGGPAGGAPDRAGPAPPSTCAGAIVAYSNDVKTALAGVPAELIERHGAVSPEVAEALAAGAESAWGPTSESA